MLTIVLLAVVVVALLILWFSRKRSVKVVVAHYKEDIEWLNKLKYDFIVYEKEKEGYKYNIPVNKGREASVYMKYIIDHYDKLPDYVIFIHGHESDWHHKESMVKKINSLLFFWDYFNLNDSGCKFTLMYDKLFLMNNIDEAGPSMVDWWEQNMEPFFGPPESYGNPINKDTCCSQFVVSKKNILRHPIEFYKHQYNWLITTDIDNFYSGRYYEWLWKFIFSTNSK